MTPFKTTDLLQEALTLHRGGDVAGAAMRYANIARVDPANPDAQYYLGVIACQQGRYAEGAEFARKSLANDAQHARAHVLLGRALSALGCRDEALASFNRAIVLAPDVAQAYGHRGDVLSDLGRNAEAIESYDQALALAPDLLEEWFNRGAVLFAVARYDDALASFDHVIAGKPDAVDAHLWRAKVLSQLHRDGDALAAVDAVITRNTDLADAWVARGIVLTALERAQEAFSAFERALALKPDTPEAWLGRAHLFNKADKDQEALAAYDRALSLKKDFAEAWFGRGTVAIKRVRYDEAFAAFEKAYAYNPDLNHLAGYRIHVKQYLCDRTDLQADIARLLEKIRQGRPASVPFPLLAVPSASPADQLKCAKRYVQDQVTFPPIWRGEVYDHDRIRVAYLSADFGESPAAYLTVGLFEHHDRGRFDVTGISFGPDRKSKIRRRIVAAFDRFVDAQQSSDHEVADLLRRHEIDIVVDLMGFTRNSRLNVLARRAAPIQVSYLGYPGTMGAPYIDYLVADQTTIPEEQAEFYSEQVVWLPDSYYINDNRREIAERVPSRGECGLPEQAFVFCCFNNTFKIAPESFDIWMGLLRSVENSVLWLLEGNPTATENLRGEAEKRGIPSRRLIFAARTTPAEHLARHRHADLCLDTLPYNAHTTGCDALWTGVPIVTCLGTTFVGRVAASLLKAIGLDELIAHSPAEYEVVALKFARDLGYRASIKTRLARNRDTFPLFDTQRSTRNMELAYTAMLDLHRGGKTHRAGPIRIG